MNPISDSVTAMDAELQAARLDNEELRTRNASLELCAGEREEQLEHAAQLLREWLAAFDRTRLGERVRATRELLALVAGVKE